MRHHDFGDGRWVVRLDPGEDVLPCLAAFAAAAGVTAGYATAIGSVDRLTLGFLDPETRAYLKRTFEEPMEVASLTASFSMDGDQPLVHAHAVVGPRELIAYAGHLHAARVGAVLEVYVTALPGRLGRAAVPDQPFLALLLPGEAPPGGSAPPR